MTTQTDIEDIFRRHYAAMFRLAAAMTHDTEGARDIVHDTFEAIMRGGITDVSAGYLLSAVRNRCLNRLRDLDTRQRVRELVALDTENTADSQEWPDEETLDTIRKTVATILSDSARRVVTMRFYRGYTCREIAEELSISENSVHKALRNAIISIRKHLTANG